MQHSRKQCSRSSSITSRRTSSSSASTRPHPHSHQLLRRLALVLVLLLVLLLEGLRGPLGLIRGGGGVGRCCRRQRCFPPVPIASPQHSEWIVAWTCKLITAARTAAGELWGLRETEGREISRCLWGGRCRSVINMALVTRGKRTHTKTHTHSTHTHSTHTHTQHTQHAHDTHAANNTAHTRQSHRPPLPAHSKPHSLSTPDTPPPRPPPSPPPGSTGDPPTNAPEG